MKKTINSEYSRNCPSCNETLYYNNTSSLNLAIRENKKCRKCAKFGKKTKKNHPEEVINSCELCKSNFTVTWKYRKQRFCSTKCMHGWRTNHAWVSKKCLHCNTEFKSRKKENRIFCSNDCNRSSEQKRNKLIKWSTSQRNHFNNEQIQHKVRTTKIKKYGNILGPVSRISKGQRKLYEELKKTHKDAILEHYLKDVGKSVDIFIPSKNLVVEYFGDYWHCNPIKYKKSYYHKTMKLTAEEIWKKDEERIADLKENGYDVSVVWEYDTK